MRQLTEKERKIFEDLGWKIEENDECFDISNYSPAGEDLCEAIWDDKSIVENLQAIADDFDPEEHADMWYNMRACGQPTSLRELLKDADAIKKMYETLLQKFKEV